MFSRSPKDLQQLNEFEKVVLGCILINPNCLYESPQINANSFQSGRNRDVFQSILELHEKDIPIDVVTVAKQLAETGRIQAIGGPHYVNELMEASPNVVNFGYYVGEILEKQRETEFRKLLEQSLDDLRNGKNINEVMCNLKDLENVPGKEKFEFLTAAGLINGEFSHEYLINGVLVKGQPCIIAGPKKCLKTNILIALAVSLATGHPFLGKFHVTKAGNVGVMSGESGPATIQETFLRIAKSIGWTPNYIEGLHFCFELPAIHNQLDLLHIRRNIKEKKLDVLIIDPAYLCLSLGDGASNLFSVGEKLKPLSILGQETGCTIILVHHTRKSNGQNEFSEPQLEEIAFAGFQEWARQWILLNRREAYQPDNEGVHKLHFVAGGSAGHSQSWALDIKEGSIDDEGGRVWETRLFPSQEARAEKRTSKEQDKQRAMEARFEEDMNKIVLAIEKLGKPSPASTIRDKAKLSTPRTKAALFELKVNGNIESTIEKSGNGHDCEHYNLVIAPAGCGGIQRDKEVSRSSEHNSGIGPPCKGDHPVVVRASESDCKQRDKLGLVDSNEENYFTERL